MKVALVGDLVDEQWLSMDLYLSDIGRHLKTFLNDSLFILNPRTEDLSISRLLAGKSKRPWARYIEYPFIVCGIKADIYHIVDHSYAHIVHWLPANRTIVTCHDLAGFHQWEGNYLSKLIWKMYGVTGLKKAARLVAISEATRCDIIRFLNYPAARIDVVYYGVESQFRKLENQEKLRRNLMDKLNIPGDGALILHVGSSQTRKNIRGIIQAIYYIVARLGMDAYLIKVGSDLTEKQRALAMNLGIGSRIRYLGAMSNSNLPFVYNACDVLLFPSFIEGFGRPVLEAMACGLPVVCSNVSALAEISKDAAVQVDPTNIEEMAFAVYTVLTQPRLRETLVREGLKRAQNFTWRKHAEKLYQVYNEVLSLCV